jgi:hypothetical protein
LTKSLTICTHTALEKPSESESDSDAKHEDDAQTIKPTRSPRPTTIPLSRAGAPSAEINPIIEDYSDLAADEDENALQSKLSEFKVSGYSASFFSDPRVVSYAYLSPRHLHLHLHLLIDFLLNFHLLYPVYAHFYR